MSHPDEPVPPHGDAAPPGSLAAVPGHDATAWYRALFDAHPSPLLLYDAATLRLLAANAAAVRQYGYAPDELLAMTITELRPPEDTAHLLAHLAAPTPDGVRRGVFRHRRRDGSVFRVRITSHPVEAGGRPARLVTAEDLSEPEALERELAQAQRMEAVGRLAGGMAHDFNTLLTTILTSCDLLAGAIPPGSVLREDVQAIREAAARGAALTAKLLALSRRRPLELQPLDLDAHLGELSRLLRQLVPESIELTLAPTAGGAPARADPGAVEQIVIHLVTNAWEAMPGGGALTIGTARATLDAAFCLDRPGATPGDYVAVTVRDTGAGMDETALRRVLDPFFSTKTSGEGTGLGMAAVYGLVKQQGGYLDVASRPGAGTTVTVYLPATAEPPRPDAGPDADAGAATSRTILLVEDEAALRRAATRALTRAGYAVVAATDGRDALELLERAAAVDLVVTDMVMPRLGGGDLIRELRASGRGVPVLVTSGYPGQDGGAPAEVPAGAHFLAKPWTIAELLAAVKGALGRPTPDGLRRPAPDETTGPRT